VHLAADSLGDPDWKTLLLKVNVIASGDLFTLLYKFCCELLFFDDGSAVSAFLVHYQLER
jgi:hypothetical protein